MVWTEKQGLITDLQLQNGLLVFTAGAEAGNTLVAAVDAAGTVLWSWHIWCTGGEVPADKTVQNFTEKRIRMMDRFLGAHSVTGKEATLYEFGRKDPFSNAETLYVDGRSTSIYYKWYSYATRDEAGADNAAAILYATRHPDTYITGGGAGGWIPTRDQTLWGDVNGWDEKYAVGMNTFSGGKTIYDPCPVGYRVPNVWSFSGFSKESVLYPAWNGGWWLKGTPDDTDGIFFAGVGYWLNYSNTVWDAKGTYIWRDGMTRYSHTWCASSALRGSGNAATFRVYHENEHNCDVYSGDTRPGSYGMPVRCVRDNYAY